MPTYRNQSNFALVINIYQNKEGIKVFGLTNKRLSGIIFLILIYISSAYSQRAETVISGKVFSTEKGIVEFATVYLKNTGYGSVTNQEGIYHMSAKPGSYTLVVSAIGYETAEQDIELLSGERIKLNVSLRPSVSELEEVVVTGGGISKINNSAFNAVAIDTKKLGNTTLDLAHALNRVSGVKIREEGGLGSGTQINLNGFTGRHVKIFIDGVPMEGSGSSFQLNNIPANLADRIEVYKGVVPVEFGGDALGGAINIVTNRSSNTFIDASYSYGSFNTHKSNLNLGYTAKNGFTVQLNAYQNYSDNDYKVKTRYTDIATSSVSQEEQWFRRFHDRYHNEAVILQLGVVNKPWADRFIIGANYSREYAQIQNANLMTIVFGGKYRTAEGLTPSLNYEKKNFIIKNLDVNLSAKYSDVLTNNVDTVAREYSWTGDYREKDTQGEGVATLAEYKGKTAYAVANIRYRIGENHFFAINNMYSNYTRKTTNSAANSVQSSAATFMRRRNEKNITGLSYKYVSEERWNAMLFAKYYYSDVCGPVNVATTGRDQYEEQTRTTDALGYGFAGTYHFSSGFQYKLSLEKTFRLPTDMELFGDGDYENGEANLRPESSRNVNMNFSYHHTSDDKHSFSFDLGVYGRYVQDYIIRTIGTKGVATSTNHGKVLGLGGDVTARYYYKKSFTAGANFSYLDMRDKERHTAIGAESVTYNNRVPNLPYVFGNADAAYTFFKVFGNRNTLTLGYNFMFVNKFFRSWAGEGAKLYIPRQMSHDANITYSIRDGRFNIAAEAVNIGNAILYDNYSLQKPGRSFSVKFRYFFFKQHNN